MTTRIASGCDGLPSFRHFCDLSCFAVRDVRDCHSPHSYKKHLIYTVFCTDAFWFKLKANQSACTDEVSLVCSVTQEEAH